MMTKLFLAAALMIPVGASAVAYNNSDEAVRSDCPGKIECPLTGELVCKDRCSLAAAKDKKGATKEATTDSELSPCCRNRLKAK